MDIVKRLDAQRDTYVPPQTRFQRAALVGVRATQIDNGSPLCIDAQDRQWNDSLALAVREQRMNAMPIQLVIRNS